MPTARDDWSFGVLHARREKPRGVASAQFKSGKYSKDIPTRMAAAYNAARTDPELLHQRDEISLLDSRLLDMLGRVDTGESGKIWRLLRAELTTLRTDGKDKLAQHISEMARLIEVGYGDSLAWSEIITLLESRRRLVESERKRLVEMQQMITTEQAMTFVGAIVTAVSKHVADRGVLAAISREIELFTVREDVSGRSFALPAPSGGGRNESDI